MDKVARPKVLRWSKGYANSKKKKRKKEGATIFQDPKGHVGLTCARLAISGSMNNVICA